MRKLVSLKNQLVAELTMFKLLKRYVLLFWKTILVLCTLIIISALLSIIAPMVVGNAIDLLLLARGIERDTAFFMAILLLLGIHLLQWLVGYLSQLVTARFMSILAFTIRNEAFIATFQRDQAWHDQQATGDLISRISNDTDELAGSIYFIVSILSSSLMVLLGMLVLSHYSLFLTGIALSFIPLAVGCGFAFQAISRRLSRKLLRSLGQITAKLHEFIKGIFIAKIFHQETLFLQEFSEVNKHHYHLSVKQGVLSMSIMPIVALLEGVALTAIIFFGAQDVTLGMISPGTLYIFIQLVTLFVFPLFTFPIMWNNAQEGLSAAERLIPILEPSPTIRQVDDKRITIQGNVVFKNVWFSYDGQGPVLRDFTLSIKAGEKVALVGHTGAGKTTVIKLLLRFYEYQQGSILIDGYDIRTLDLSHYYEQVGIISQEPYIFHDTLLENIRLVRPSATEDEVWKALETVGLDRWARSLPNGLNHVFQEGGKNLSVGMKQLVELARISLKNPQIIILDEATASLDPLTEAMILQALKKITRGKTTIVIAHRLLSVTDADNIILMDHGKIIEQGTHQELISRPLSKYRQLYEKYFVFPENCFQ